MQKAAKRQGGSYKLNYAVACAVHGIYICVCVCGACSCVFLFLLYWR